MSLKIQLVFPHHTKYLPSIAYKLIVILILTISLCNCGSFEYTWQHGKRYYHPQLAERYPLGSSMESIHRTHGEPIYYFEVDDNGETIYDIKVGKKKSPSSPRLIRRIVQRFEQESNLSVKYCTGDVVFGTRLPQTSLNLFGSVFIDYILYDSQKQVIGFYRRQID